MSKKIYTCRIKGCEHKDFLTSRGRSKHEVSIHGYKIRHLKGKFSEDELEKYRIIPSSGKDITKKSEEISIENNENEEVLEIDEELPTIDSIENNEKVNKSIEKSIKNEENDGKSEYLSCSDEEYENESEDIVYPNFDNLDFSQIGNVVNEMKKSVNEMNKMANESHKRKIERIETVDEKNIEIPLKKKQTAKLSNRVKMSRMDLEQRVYEMYMRYSEVIEGGHLNDKLFDKIKSFNDEELLRDYQRIKMIIETGDNCLNEKVVSSAIDSFSFGLSKWVFRFDDEEQKEYINKVNNSFACDKVLRQRLGFVLEEKVMSELKTDSYFELGIKTVSHYITNFFSMFRDEKPNKPAEYIRECYEDDEGNIYDSNEQLVKKAEKKTKNVLHIEEVEEDEEDINKESKRKTKDGKIIRKKKKKSKRDME